MKKIIYILFLITLMVSCTKEQPLKTNGVDNQIMFSPIHGNLGIIDPDKDDSHDGDGGIGIVDPDKDDEHDTDSKKKIKGDN